MRIAEDQTGKQYGHLIVIGKHTETNSYNKSQWQCQCRCGKVTIATASMLNAGRKKSCGCGRNEHQITHGMTHSSEYKIWRGMLARCHNPRTKNYKNYGGRGILICARWMTFDNFYADMGPRPSDDHSIDRENVDGHYDPKNCRWATYEEQFNNKRNSVKYTVNEIAQTISQLAKGAGLKRSTLDHRLNRGASIEEALSRPLHKRSKQ